MFKDQFTPSTRNSSASIRDRSENSLESPCNRRSMISATNKNEDPLAFSYYRYSGKQLLQAFGNIY